VPQLETLLKINFDKELITIKAIAKNAE
jgi:hypothetical protein